jgi:four helix bundle protein
MFNDPEYIAWLATVPPEITQDTMWRMTGYRLAMFLLTKSQDDVALIIRCRETRTFADQLLDAVGGISANVEDGYSRSARRERAHFYEYALSCAREARGWYFRCARAFPRDLLASRIRLLTHIIRILTKVVPDERESARPWQIERESRPHPNSKQRQQAAPVTSNQSQ